MFVRVKNNGKYDYLQVVHNERVAEHVRQNVIATLGRLDVLKATGKIDALIASCARFAEHTAVINASRRREIPVASKVRIGPPLVFERLWKELGFPEILTELLCERKYEFSIERAVFLTVLHRLFISGSDRAAERWKQNYSIEGTEELELQHLYRAMAWLGTALGNDEQWGATPFAPRCTKDLIEEALFDHKRDLFSDLSIVFFDTTSIYFESEGGETGEYGNTKDHRPDLKQMVVGVVLDKEGNPICSELWPGNTTDVKTLIPVVDRLRSRFGVKNICVVADRGMISKKTIEELQVADRDIHFILGARMRKVKEVRDEVLSRPGRYREVYGARKCKKDPAPLKVKEVRVGDRRYIVSHNEDQEKKDREDRQAIVASLKDQLKQGAKSLVGNKGFRKYLKSISGGFKIDEKKIKSEARYDGKWVLQTDMEDSAEQIALKYKELLMVEQFFRCIKSILETRPIYHKRTETIRGHVFCSFLALVLLKDLQRRMEERGWRPEWAHLRDDLNELEEVTVETKGRSFLIRTRTEGEAGKAIQAAGIALGPVVRLTGSEKRPRD